MLYSGIPTGDNSGIGAGSVVTQQIPAHLVVGEPLPHITQTAPAWQLAPYWQQWA
ncbi:MAG: hypothetical protein ACUVRV_04780 [Cyanobacteriota bacterium]